MDKIEISGARTKNLKNINLTIPQNKLTVITGLSGSGKSSLALGTIYAKGQGRYLESLSSYARQFLLPFLSPIEIPDVDHIKGLSPVISISQKTTLYNARSTVGTTTEIYNYLRLLFARIGEPRCPDHNLPLQGQTISQMVDNILSQAKDKRLMLLAPVTKYPQENNIKILDILKNQGYVRARIDGKIYDLFKTPRIDLHKRHTIEVVIDRIKVTNNISQRLSESLETTLTLSGGTAIIVDLSNTQAKDLIFSTKFACPTCGYSIFKLEPQLFSFNSPLGSCQICNGLGIQEYFDLNRIIQNPQLSLANGAIYGWDRQNVYYFQMLESVANHYKFDIEVPWAHLDTTVCKIILYGSGKDNLEFKYIDNNGDISVSYQPFEGILPNMKRRYKETKSNAVRKELTKFINSHQCISCKGTRLGREARHVYVANTSLPFILNMSIQNATDFFKNLKLSEHQEKIAKKILKEISNRLEFLVNIGVKHLTLSCSMNKISRGEAQRIRLAGQINTGLVGIIYILDEPSISLHQYDNEHLFNTLLHLRNLGNTVIIVEYSENIIRIADHIIDIGPGAGVYGGQIVAEGSIEAIISAPESITGQYISGKQKIKIPKKRVSPNSKKVLELIDACGNNLKNITLKLPVGLFTCITGVSGSGKSTLINHTLFPVAQQYLNGVTTSKPAPYRDIQGMEHFNKVININQKLINRTPHANLATYINIFTTIRKLFAGIPESRSRGYTARRFSFNMHGGRCEVCQGNGIINVNMHFMSNIRILCDQCKGQRYNRETLEIKYKGKNIQEILNMTAKTARKFFDSVPVLAYKLQTLIDVGLTYISLGQSITTLSGGEVQRMKLARELCKYSKNKILYILDKPSTSLHFADIQLLINILHQLRDQGNTVVVIEHNLDIIKTADWIIDLGPEEGNNGGKIIASGAPEVVAKCKASHTARFLKSLLQI